MSAPEIEKNPPAQPRRLASRHSWEEEEAESEVDAGEEGGESEEDGRESEDDLLPKPTTFLRQTQTDKERDAHIQSRAQPSVYSHAQPAAAAAAAGLLALLALLAHKSAKTDAKGAPDLGEKRDVC